MKKISVLICVGSLILCVLLFSGCGTRTYIKGESLSADAQASDKKEDVLIGPKRRVAVIEFENKTIYGKRRLGSSAADILVTELKKSGRFILVEREKINKILEEQKFQYTGAVVESTVGELGKILGVSALITGSVSQFGVKTESGSAIISESKTQTAQAVVDVRVVDIATGKLLYAESAKGTAKKTSSSFLGIGGSSGYDETLEGDALRASIIQLVQIIISKIDSLSWNCTVAEIMGDKIYLDAGKETNLQIGSKLDIFRTTKEIKGSTGEVIGKLEDKICTLEVVEHFGENGSIAKLVSGAVPQNGDICRIVK